MAGAGALILWQVMPLGAPVQSPADLPWWVIAFWFAVTEVAAIDLRVRHDAHSVSLVQVPFVFGLATLAPAALIAARLVGETAALVLYRRRKGERLAFDLATVFLETAVAASIFHGVLLGGDPAGPAGWLAAGAATGAALAVSTAAVSISGRSGGTRRGLRQAGPSMLAAIAMSAAGTVVAVIALVLVDADPWTVVILAPAGILLLAGLRVFESLFRRHQDLELVHGFTEAVGESVEMATVLRDAMKEARRVFHVADVLVVVRRGEQMIRLHSTAGGHSERDEEEAGWPALLDSLHGEAAFGLGGDDPVSRFAAEAGIREGLAVPLTGDGAAFGLLAVGNRLTGLVEFDDSDVRLLTTVGRQLAVALERARLVTDVRREAEEREHRALHDSLTGLPNRTSFVRAIERLLAARPPDEMVAVTIVDLDRFKEINDTLGHHHGDLVLQEVASRLTDRVREADIVARLGGDEFGVMITGLRTPSAAVTWTRRMADALAEPLAYDGLSLLVSGSIGVAVAPDDASDAAGLLRRAEVAMYHAKRSGTGMEMYTPEHDPHSTRRLAIIGELAGAIEAGELVVHYQPKVRLSDGAVVGVEALVRWQHPRLGMLQPPDFIEPAETAGLIGPLTEFVLDTAVGDAAALAADGHDLEVSINVSARCFTTALPERVSGALADAGLDPARLTLEITESAAVADSAAAIAVVERLAGLGVRLAVDDFGTGYSSLVYLTSLPVRELKIDRSFVSTMGTVTRNARIVESAIGLARSLGLSTVAEGVETERSWLLLQRMGCDLAQGFLVSRPMPVARLRAWLGDRSSLAGRP
jgi:diguanylate cyclase (GGDEF)-like protein